jgi:signal transduction histidine kinase/ActR/RegA family two-component response regulator
MISRPPRSLRQMLTTALVAVTIVPLAAVGVAGLLFATGTLGSEVKARNLQLARAIGGEVGRYAERQGDELREVAGHVDEALEAGRDLGPVLDARREENPGVDQLFVLDTTGRVMAVSPRDAAPLGTDLSRLSFVAAARARGADAWSPPTAALDSGDPRVALVSPQPSYTLLAYFDLAAIAKVVAAGGGVHESEVALLDHNGTVLAHPDPVVARDRRSVLDQPLVHGAMAGVEATAELEWRGRRWLGSAVRVAPTGWVVLVTEPAAQAFAAVGRLRMLFAVALSAAFVAAVLVGRWVTTRLVGPIEALSGRAREVAAGRYGSASGAVPGSGAREIIELTRSFASMAGEVQAREEGRARSERELRAVVDNPLVGVVRTRFDGTVLYVNAAFARIMAAPGPEAFVGRSILPVYVDPVDRENLLAEVRSEGRAVNRELRSRAFDGTERSLLVNVASDGQNLITLVVDVTDLRRAASDRERLEQQLFHAQKMEAVGRLAGGVAHDFNNLLTAIVGFAGLLRDAVPEGHEDRPNLEGIVQSAERASHLTRSLLAYSRRQLLDRRPVDVGEVILAVEKLLGRLIGEDVVLAVSLPDEPLVIVADAGQLEQVLLNLATNARDAMPGGGSLGIAADGVELDGQAAAALGLRRSGRYVRITVSDTGHGIPDEVKEKLFEPFFTTKPAGKGTGLGLAIVDGIVKQHAGHVAVESEPGRGTTFTILLEREVARPRAPGTAPERHGPRGHESVLLVEDEPLVRRAFRRTLERAGYVVTEASDGEEALAAFAAEPDRYDLCLVDMVMPRRNGPETAAAITGLRPGVPVLLASGYAADVLADRGQLMEGAEFVMKPVAPDELLARVRELLDRAAARG